MKWIFVYNSSLTQEGRGSDKIARQKAKEAGYLFYMWNTIVRFTADGESTGITDRDMI